MKETQKRVFETWQSLVWKEGKDMVWIFKRRYYRECKLMKVKRERIIVVMWNPTICKQSVNWESFLKTLWERRGGETSREVGLGSSSSSSSLGQRRMAILSKLRDDSSVLDLLLLKMRTNQGKETLINK